MTPDQFDQDKLAEEWASALGDSDEGSEEAGGGQDFAPADDKDSGGLASEWAQALADEEEKNIKAEKRQEFLSSRSQVAEFKDLTHEAKSPRPEQTKRDLDFILDIPLEVSAELGRTKLLINELLQLGQGSVVELNKLAGEPLEIYVNGKLVARGEAVVINEKFGIRLTDIISPIERVKQLG
ncbi:flagellar motor switch protein FliN [Desulfocurvibacter africanus]|uniref:flagellar motor switch protein FliN n=1 Tax=Desulfocurvibacter africanus TaxID=873 RepID=UPI002FDAD7E7